MPTVGTRVNTVTFVAPEFGTRHERCIALGYGKNLVASESAGRRSKAFYSIVATSGKWFVNLIFGDFEEKENFNTWLSQYYSRVIDVWQSPLLPMTVTVPSRGFKKVGYPTSTVDFGDQVGKVTWTLALNFMSATDPTISTAYASKFLPPLTDTAATHFYPSGTLSNEDVNVGIYNGVSESEGEDNGGVQVLVPGTGVLQ